MIGLQYIIELEEMTPSELAEKIGVSLSLVYRWIRGKKPIPKQRTIQIHTKVFPEYPEEYLNKELNEPDVTIIHNIWRSKTSTADYKIKKLLDYCNNYTDEVKETLVNISGMLSISDKTKMMNNKNMNASVFMLMLSTVLGEQATVLSDLKAFYKLEACKGQRSATILVSIALSALCEVLGIGGYIDDIVCAEPLRIVLSNDSTETGTFDREIHDQLKTFFAQIIERYDKRDKILQVLNNKIKEEKQ